jgi:hypothetical protein
MFSIQKPTDTLAATRSIRPLHSPRPPRYRRSFLPYSPYRVLRPGAIVKVNCYHARILRVIETVDSYNPYQHQQSIIPLRNPLYEIELDLSRKHSWNTRQVFIPEGASRMKLFADEFVVVQQ